MGNAEDSRRIVLDDVGQFYVFSLVYMYFANVYGEVSQILVARGDYFWCVVVLVVFGALGVLIAAHALAQWMNSFGHGG